MSDPGGYRSYATDDLVTGEGVAVELPTASVGARMASGAIDVVLTIAVLVAGFIAFGLALGEASDAVIGIVSIVLSTLVVVGMPATIETASRGRSLGRLALGLRTVRDDGGPVTFRHALVRALVGYVEIYLLLGIPAVVASMVHPRAKRLGDMAAGTVVVSQRASLRLSPPPEMPPALHHWASTADVTALPSGLTVAVRQFLARAPGLSPQSRHTLGVELLHATLPHVSPAPPPGHHPEAVLSAVVAERRRRDLVRLWREEQLRARVLPADPLSARSTPPG
ncbi:RDD family protein [Fodinibacter luteus]|uniref:RDD family protein n=1 Tax=Fodinibacter luteus TaxID=552064 RepID=A0ABP8JZK2_9MICO